MTVLTFVFCFSYRRFPTSSLAWRQKGVDAFRQLLSKRNNDTLRNAILPDVLSSFAGETKEAASLSDICAAYSIEEPLQEDWQYRSSVWQPGSDFERWLRRLLIYLIFGTMREQQDLMEHFTPFVELALSDISFAEYLLPRVVHAKLRKDVRENVRPLLSSSLEAALRSIKDMQLDQDVSQAKCVKVLISVLSFLQTVKVDESVSHKYQRGKRAKFGETTVWDSFFWLDVDYVLVASACLRVGDYTGAVFYATISTDSLLSHDGGPSFSSIQGLLSDAFEALQFADGLQATTNLRDEYQKYRLYAQMGNYGAMLSTADLLGSEGSHVLPAHAPAPLLFAESLMHLGYYNVAQDLHVGDVASARAIRARAAWKQQFWTSELDSSLYPLASINHENRTVLETFDPLVLGCLHDLQRRSFADCMRKIELGRQFSCKDLFKRHDVLEMPDTLTELQIFTELEEAARLLETSVSAERMAAMVSTWSARNGRSAAGGVHHSSIETLRISLVEIAISMAESQESELCSSIHCEYNLFYYFLFLSKLSFRLS